MNRTNLILKIVGAVLVVGIGFVQWTLHVDISKTKSTLRNINEKVNSIESTLRSAESSFGKANEDTGKTQQRLNDYDAALKLLESHGETNEILVR